jgi:hypothetical protein
VNYTSKVTKYATLINADEFSPDMTTPFQLQLPAVSYCLLTYGGVATIKMLIYIHLQEPCWRFAIDARLKDLRWSKKPVDRAEIMK